MFDTLLAFVEKNYAALLDIYVKELQKQVEEEKEEKAGILTIMKSRNSADVRFYKPEDLPYDDLKEEYITKKLWLEESKQTSILMKDKWIVNMPLLDKEILQEIGDTPALYIILDAGDKQVLFVGVPQKVNEDDVQYVLVAESKEILVSKHFWCDETTTLGQKYMGTCQAASKFQLNYLVFRSDRKFCDMICKGDRQYGENVLRKLQMENSAFLAHLPKVRMIDCVGAPVTHDYKLGRFSVETLRHMRTAHLAKQNFGKLKGWRVCELGGSYGALCYLMNLVANLESYDFIEISYCVDLAMNVLKELKKDNKVRFIDTMNLIEPDEKSDDKNAVTIERIDLFISEYALEGLTEDGIRKYDWLLRSAKNGLLVTKLEHEQDMSERLRNYFTDVITEKDPMFPNEIVLICRDISTLKENNEN